jgi:hypothetical protein
MSLKRAHPKSEGGTIIRTALWCRVAHAYACQLSAHILVQHGRGKIAPNCWVMLACGSLARERPRLYPDSTTRPFRHHAV